MLSKIQKFFDELSLFLVIPVVIVTIFTSIMMTTSLTPKLGVIEDDQMQPAEDVEDADVLGAQRYYINEVGIEVSQDVINIVTYDKSNKDLEIYMSLPKRVKHSVRENSLKFINESSKWRTISITPSIEEIPTGIEIAVTEGNVSHVLVDSKRNIYPAELNLAPNEKIILGFRIDAVQSLNYDFDMIYEVGISNN
jgi:hypothetical protein